MSYLLICSKLNSLSDKGFLKLDFDLNENFSQITVKRLSNLVAKQLGINDKIASRNDDEDFDDKKLPFDLICLGRQLRINEKLAAYGIKNGSIIYVFKKSKYTERFEEKHIEEKLKSDEHTSGFAKHEKGKRLKYDQSEINRIVVALRTALINPAFRSMLNKLQLKEFREDLIACTPGLKNDPVSFAILQKSDLLALLTDPDNISKVIENHPALCDAAMHLAAAFHEEMILSSTTAASSAMTPGSPSVTASSSTTNGDAASSSQDVLYGFPSGHGYSLDDISEDEDLVGGVDAAPPAGQHVMPPRTSQAFHHLMHRANEQPRITAQMLQQAIAAVPQASLPTNSSVASNFPNTSNQPVSMANTMSPTNTFSNNNSRTSHFAGSSLNTSRDWSVQLRQLNDLGIFDDVLSIQALEATNGDVQAAIHIIFGDSSN